MHRFRVGLVHGGAAGVFTESEAALRMLVSAGARVTYIAVNECGAVFPGTLHHWGSMHPEGFPAWEEARRERGLPGGYTKWSVSRSPHADRRVRRWRGGSSGLHGVDIALTGLGLDAAICCGVPMDSRVNAFKGKAWSEFRRHRSAWTGAVRGFGGRVRSMSGWTRELLGAPSLEWLEALEVVHGEARDVA